MSRNIFAVAANEDGVFRDHSNSAVGTIGGIPMVRSLSQGKSTMDDVTRPEMDAKLELVEARMDARLARMEAVVERIGDDLKSITKSTSNFKYWAIGTAIAVVIGLYAANVSLLQGYVAEFDFRYNNRKALGVEDSERADKLLRGAKGKRLTYQTTTI